MKNVKLNIPELVRAAQTAGASESNQEFWRDVDAYLAHREAKKADLVSPRRLTELEKPRTL